MGSAEYNFDGLVGPTHNYAGLSYGNIASMKNASKVSSPRQAALQGLEKMRFVASLGVRQAILPPHERPHVSTLRRLGYTGSDAQMLEKAAKDNPHLLSAVCSSSHMWAANAATVSSSLEAEDHRVHFSPANLLTQFHRSIEPPTTTRILRRIFADEARFSVHDPLPSTPHFADEGAANHTRLSSGHDHPGIEVFVFGRGGFDNSIETKFPARQTREASVAVARLHGVAEDRFVLLQQSPSAIDAGAFHNDVVAVGHRDVLLMHQRAFHDPNAVADLKERFKKQCASTLHVVTVSDQELSLEDAIATYLFNSQIVTLANGRLAMIAPVECGEHKRARAVCERILAGDNPIAEIRYVDVRQSMRNGGGPACLRLRVTLTEVEAMAMHQGIVYSEPLHARLRDWVERHYRDSVGFADLSDPSLLKECRDALDELTKILDFGDVYEFQG